MSALDDRRQSALEAFWDRFGGPSVPDNTMSGSAIKEAIETATRVRITPEMIAASDTARALVRIPVCTIECVYSQHSLCGPALAERELAGLRAAFEAAGFEVEGFEVEE